MTITRLFDRSRLVLLTLSLAAMAGGCAGRTSLVPNPDPKLRKTSAAFAADAAKRHYPAEAPHGNDAVARSQIEYTFKHIDVTNLSPDVWENVEVWVNQRYVVFIPKMEPKTNKRLDFQMIYDSDGSYFQTTLNGKKQWVDKVELFRDGKLYEVPKSLAD